MGITPEDIKSYFASEIMFRKDNSLASILVPLGFKGYFNTSDLASIFPELLDTYGERSLQIVLMPGDIEDKWQYQQVE